MRLTSEQIQKILEGAVDALMQKLGCDRATAMRMVEENGVQVRILVDGQEQNLFISFKEKPPFQAND